jgi:hypothetical protein
MTRRQLRTGLLLALGAMPIVACGQAESDDGSQVLLEESFSENGKLIVSQDIEGNLNMVVRGRIGVDDHALAERAFNAGSLEETYRILRPQASTVPADIHALSERLTAQKAANLAQLPAGELTRRPAEATFPKDSNAFYSTACQTFGGGFSGYYPSYCAYQYNWHSLCTYNTLGTSDRTFAWNESAYAGKQTLSGFTSTLAIPAWTWQWASWGGSYSKRYACVVLNGTAQGNLGVTHHDYFTDENTVPVGPD